MTWMMAKLDVLAEEASNVLYEAQLWNTDEQQKDSFRNSAPDIFPAAPSLRVPVLDLGVTFRRSSRLAAYVQHLERHRSPGEHNISSSSLAFPV
jgi:hypothetical protein